MRLLIHLEAGLVQSVSSDVPIDAEVVVINYDTKDVEPEEIHKVPQSADPTYTADACISWHGKVDTTDRNITEYLNSINVSR